MGQRTRGGRRNPTRKKRQRGPWGRFPIDFGYITKFYFPLKGSAIVSSLQTQIPFKDRTAKPSIIPSCGTSQPFFQLAPHVGEYPQNFGQFQNDKRYQTHSLLISGSLKFLLLSIPPHLSSSDDIVDLESLARYLIAGYLTQPLRKSSLGGVVYQKSTDPLETCRGASTRNRGFLKFHPPHFDINLLDQISRFCLHLSKQSDSLLLFS